MFHLTTSIDRRAAMRSCWLTFVGAVALFAILVSTGSNALAASTDPTERHVERYLKRMQPLLQRYGYTVIAAAVMVEGIGVPAPGQTLLIAGAFEAAQGRMNIAWILVLTTACAIAGNSIGYGIGRWGGRALLNKLNANVSRRQRLENMFNRHGGVVILLGRFIDGFRQLNGIVAGVLRMPWWTFTLYNVAGALLWTGAWALGTYYLGRDTHVIAAYLHDHRWLLYALSATALLGFFVWLLHARLLKSGSGIHR
jgi:membrane protein DedA with SNARE-associated domain